MARFGSVVTAMVTPVRDEGTLDPTAPSRWHAIWRARAATAWSWRAPPARVRCSATPSAVELFRTVVGGRRRPGHRVDRHQRHRPLDDAHRGGRVAGAAAPSSSPRTTTAPRRPGSVGPLPCRGRCDRPAGRALRHPGPLRPAHRPRPSCELAREVPNIVAVKDATGDLAVGRGGRRGIPRTSRSTAETTRSPCRSLAVGGVGRDQCRLALGRPALRRACSAATAPATSTGGRPQRGALRVLPLRVDRRVSRTRCRQKRPAGCSGSRPASAVFPSSRSAALDDQAAFDRRAAGPGVGAQQSVA